MSPQSKTVAYMLVVFFAVFIWSAIRPRDEFTWFLEVLPAAVGLVILGAIYPRFKFTTFVCTFMLLHAIVLMVGGHYTYAEVPIGNWARDYFGLERNHYDRLGHFMQGFVPALIVREVLVRNRVVKSRGWLTLLVFASTMMITSVYELLEYAVAMAAGSAADIFLGSQGDPWDTQKDMLMCLIGSVTALMFFGGAHDRAILRAEYRARAAARA